MCIALLRLSCSTFDFICRNGSRGSNGGSSRGSSLLGSKAAERLTDPGQACLSTLPIPSISSSACACACVPWLIKLVKSVAQTRSAARCCCPACSFCCCYYCPALIAFVCALQQWLNSFNTSPIRIQLGSENFPFSFFLLLPFCSGKKLKAA